MRKVIFLYLMCVMCNNRCLATEDNPISLIDPETPVGKAINILNRPVVSFFGMHLRLQMGRTVPLSYGLEVCYGNSTGIVWYPKPLKIHKNFEIGFFDINVNFLSLLYDALRTTVVKDCYYKGDSIEQKKNECLKNFLKKIVSFNLLGNVHLLSFRFFSFIKFRIFSAGGIFFFFVEKNYEYSGKKEIDPFILALDFLSEKKDDEIRGIDDLSPLYTLFSPRLQIDFFECFKFFS